MSDDIVTRLRNSFTTKDYPMLKDHCESCAIPKDWGGHHNNCLYDEAANEIERLRAFADHLAQASDIDRVRLMSRIIALEIGAIDD